MKDDLHWFLDAAIIHDPETGRSFLNMKPDEFELKIRQITAELRGEVYIPRKTINTEEE